MKWLPGLMIAAACGAPSTSVAQRPTPLPIAPLHPASAPGRIAPEDTAGLYWEPYMPCDACDRPAAFVAYVAPDERTARTIVTALDGKLAFGLPFVVHSGELHITPSGIAIVTGAFSSVAAGEAARAKLGPIAGVAPAVHDVESAENSFGNPDRYVTVVDRGGPVPAWSSDDVRAGEAAVEETDDPEAHQTMESQRRWVQRRVAKRAPLCMVQPGDMFVVDDQIAWYLYAPVRCNGKPAFIEWTRSTMGHAVIVREGDGYRLYQVVGAECDTPIIESWRYDAGGRRARNESTLVASAGC